MSIRWIEDERRTTLCPVCDLESDHEIVVEVEGNAFMRCDRCGSKFRDPRVPPAYEADVDREALWSFYEVLGSIELGIRPLFWVRSSAVRSYVDVGSGFGHCIDFGRFAFSWRTLGIEPAPLQVGASREVGLNVVPGYLDDSTTINEKFDLVGSFDVLEHVPDPRAFLRQLARLRASSGSIILKTPDADCVERGQRDSIVEAFLNVQHLVLFTPRSLEMALRELGLPFVYVGRDECDLIAIAGADPSILEPKPFDRELYTRYLSDLERRTKDDRLVDAIRHLRFRELVAAGRDFAADRAFSAIRRSVRRRYGVDLGRPDEPLRATGATVDEIGRTVPLFAPSIFYERGRQLMNRAKYREAIAYFRGAIAAADIFGPVRATGYPLVGVEVTAELARAGIVRCATRLPVDEAERALADVGSQGSPAYIDAARGAFISIVGEDGTGADLLEPAVRTWLSDDGHTASHVAQTVFALAIQSSRTGRHAEAASAFERAYGACVEALAADPADLRALPLVWWAAFNAATERKLAGLDASPAMVTNRDRHAYLPPVPAEIEARLGELSS